MNDCRGAVCDTDGETNHKLDDRTSRHREPQGVTWSAEFARLIGAVEDLVHVRLSAGPVRAWRPVFAPLKIPEKC